jgi:hypothetical protein
MRTLLWLLAVVLLGASACGGDAESPSGVATAEAPPQTASRPARDIRGVTLEGERLSLAELRGRPVFVNVWSSW